MQQLHLVGFTTDHKGLILGTRRGTDEGSYVVTLDRAFVEQIEELLRLQAGEGRGGEAATGAAGNGVGALLRRPKAESRLTPRQVQTLLRSGRSVSEVAEEAGMSEDWVGRFAPPVLAEQARVIDRATGLTYIKPRIGPSTQPLGESVIWNLAERGIVLSGQAVEDAWTAFQQPDGGWVVRVSYLAERRRQHADWTVDMTLGVVKAVNRLGNELGHVEPGRRRPAALPPPAPVSVSAQRAASAPPRPAPAPPPPARPSGRLSLLANSSGGGRSPYPPSSKPEASTSPRPKPPEPVAASPAPSSPASPASAPPGPPVERKPGARQVPSRERRPRPLRPLSAPDPAASPSEPVAAASPERGSSPSAEGEGGAPPPRPRRERPLRAPSRLRRDELAEPTVAPAATSTRRPVMGPRTAEPNPPPPPSAGPPSPPRAANHSNASHLASARKISTAERFGVGRPAAASAAAQLQSAPDPSVLGDSPSAQNNHVDPLIERGAGGRRPLRARPIVIDAQSDEGDLAYAQPDVFAARDADDPVTAPVPAVNILGRDVDLGDGFDEAPAPREQALIRAGQAGKPDEAGAGPPAKAIATPDGRQGRTGRRKFRRREEDPP